MKGMCLLLCETGRHLTASHLTMLSNLAPQLLRLTHIQDSARMGGSLEYHIKMV